MKKLLVVVFVLLATAAAGYLGYSFLGRTRQTPQAFLERGKKYFEEKKYDEALIEVMNAVRGDPKNRENRNLLAQILAKQGDLKRAAAQWKAVLEYDPDDVDANLGLARVYLTLAATNPEFVTQAQEVIQKILSKDPNNVQALVLSGTASASNKDYDTSVETFQKASSLDPKNPAVSAALGTAQLLQKNLPEAEKTFLEARDANPKNKTAVVALAKYYRRARDSVKAEAALKDALALDASDRSIYLEGVNFYVQAERLDDAEKVLLEAQSKSNGNPVPSLDLVAFYQSLNRHADGRKLLLETKTKFPNDPDVATTLAMNLMGDQPKRARQEIDQLLKIAPNSAVANALLGEYQFRSGEFEAAETTLNKDVALRSPLPQVHFFLGRISMRKQDVNSAVSHFQKSLAVNERYAPARIALAEALMAQGQPKDARAHVQKVLEAEPGNPQARVLKANLDIAEKKYPDAEKELVDLVQQYPNSPVFLRRLAGYYGTVGKTADEEKTLTRAFDLSQNSDDFGNLILFYLKTNQTDIALRKLSDVPDAQKQAFHYEFLGVIFERAAKFQEAEAAYKKALERDPNRSSSEQLLFTYYMQNRRFDDALNLLERRVKKNPQDGNALALRGVVLEQQNKTPEAKRSYELALQADSNHDVASNNLAYILAGEGRDLETALKLAQGVRNRHSDDPSGADTLGWVYYKMGRLVLARDSAQFAVSKEPENPLYQYHLGVIYKSNAQIAQAETALKKALASPKEFKERGDADAALKDIAHWRNLVPSPGTVSKK